MLKKLAMLAIGTVAMLAMPLAAQAKTYYWISHGGPADPVWTYFLAGAKAWAKDTGQTVNTSFHSSSSGNKRGSWYNSPFAPTRNKTSLGTIEDFFVCKNPRGLTRARGRTISFSPARPQRNSSAKSRHA